MPEVHLPRLDEHEEEEPPAASRPASGRARSIFKIALEVVLIGTGVFLGLAGEQWRENARHRELAETSLRRFRSEIAANRKAVAAVKDYHVVTRKSVETYLAADGKTRQTVDLQVQGLRPVSFEHTAWDLAIATQALTHIDPRLAFALAHAYNSQQAYADLTHGILQAMYLRPPTENLEAFLRAMALYYDDIVLAEPELLRMYNELLPQIDRVIGESPASLADSSQ